MELVLVALFAVQLAITLNIMNLTEKCEIILRDCSGDLCYVHEYLEGLESAQRSTHTSLREYLGTVLADSIQTSCIVVVQPHIYSSYKKKAFAHSFRSRNVCQSMCQVSMSSNADTVKVQVNHAGVHLG